MENPGTTARRLFDGGYNCAQAVFLAFLNRLELEEVQAARLTNALGGGMAGTGGPCGAVSAATLVLSALYGRETAQRTGEQLERQKQTYALVKRFHRAFRDRFGETGCPQLMALGMRDSGEEKDPKFNCPLYVEHAALLLGELIDEQEAVSDSD